MELHFEHLRQVFTILKQQQFYLKPQKCSFCQIKISYFGHIVARGTVAPDPVKIKAISDWSVPKNLKGLHGFLGLFGRSYAAIALPLTSLLKKDSFKWSPEAQTTFEDLKAALISALVLSLSDFTLHLLFRLMLRVLPWARS